MQIHKQSYLIAMLHKRTWNSYNIRNGDFISDDLMAIDVYFIYKWHETQSFVTAVSRRPTVSDPGMCEVLMELWLVREKTPRRSLSVYLTVYHKSCRNCTGIKCGLCDEKLESNHLIYSTTSRSFYEYKLWSNLIIPY